MYEENFKKLTDQLRNEQNYHLNDTDPSAHPRRPIEDPQSSPNPGHSIFQNTQIGERFRLVNLPTEETQ